MTRAEILAHNRGVLSVVAIAEASSAAIRLRLRERPTRFNHAIAALDAVAEIGAEFIVPLPPDGPEVAASALPKPRAPTDGASVQEVSAA